MICAARLLETLKYLQLLTSDCILLLKKTFVNRVTLREQNLSLIFKMLPVVSLRPLAAECRDTEACDFQILTRFTQPHCLCSWSQSEICQNLDSNSAATLGPRAQVNYTNASNKNMSSQKKHSRMH